MSDIEEAIKNPSAVSAAYTVMQPRWHKLATLLAGTAAMRKAGSRYLPKHPAESPPAHRERLEATVLFNLTSLTLKSWVGRPFSDKIEVGPDTPPEIEDILKDNIDLQGNDVNVFTRRWFEKGLAKAMCHVLVEFPRKLAEDPDTPRTLADDRNANRRPYWVLVEPENLIFAHATIVDGREVLDHVRIMEHITEQVGFAEVATRQIRVLTPGKVQMYKEVKDKNQTDPEWKMFDEWETDLPIIPLVTFYSDRESFMIGKPPLIDLADLNISHWQSTSDQRAILTVSRFPILAVSGAVDDEKKLVIGPNKWLNMPDPSGKFYYVEHTGAAIEAGRRDLLDLEDQMANYGAEFLRRKPGNPTATARALDSAESTSPLMDITVRFMDALSTALGYTAMWLKLEAGGGTLKLSTDFGPEEALVADFQALIAAHGAGSISRERFNAELKRRGTLADDFDNAANESELEKEAGAMTGAPVGDIDIDPEADK